MSFLILLDFYQYSVTVSLLSSHSLSDNQTWVIHMHNIVISYLHKRMYFSGEIIIWTQWVVQKC